MPEEKKKKEEQKACPQCAEYLAGWQRARADYQNLVKETDQRMADFRHYACADLLEQMFPLVDYFKSAFKQIPESERDSSWVKGIKHIQDYVQKILIDNEVEIMEVVGEKFDPAKHEAVAEVPGDKDGIIIEEMQTGFLLQGKVIRAAKVKVSKKIKN